MINQRAVTTIRINEGTIVGRLDGKTLTTRIMTPVTLVGDVYVEATREDDGSWGYTVGGKDYFAPGFAVTAV